MILTDALSELWKRRQQVERAVNAARGVEHVEDAAPGSVEKEIREEWLDEYDKP